MVVLQLRVTVFWRHVWVHMLLNFLKKVSVVLRLVFVTKKMVENPILGTAEEGALFSLTAEGKIVVNNPHKADIELSSLNKSLS